MNTNESGSNMDQNEGYDKRKHLSVSLQTTIQQRIGDVSSHGVIDFRGLMAVISSVIDDGRVNLEDAPALSEYCISLYKTHVVPFDIPRVPQFIESFIDDAAIRAIPAIIKMALEALPQRDKDVDPANFWA